MPAIVPAPAGVEQVPVTVVLTEVTSTCVLTVPDLMYLSTSVAISFAKFYIAVSESMSSFWFFDCALKSAVFKSALNFVKFRAII